MNNQLNFQKLSKKIDLECKMSIILRELMLDRKLSAWKLAQDLNIPYGRVKSWKETSAPKVGPELLRCATYFEVSLSYLLYGIDEEPIDFYEKNDFFENTMEPQFQNEKILKNVV